MKNTYIAIIILSSIAQTQLHADSYVNGYYRKDGTYVQPHHRSDPDGNRFNNYSTEGHYNPYTGATGHVNPFPTPQPILPIR